MAKIVVIKLEIAIKAINSTFINELNVVLSAINESGNIQNDEILTKDSEIKEKNYICDEMLIISFSLKEDLSDKEVYMVPKGYTVYEFTESIYNYNNAFSYHSYAYPASREFLVYERFVEGSNKVIRDFLVKNVVTIFQRETTHFTLNLL